jgi:antibiotic biosynthesis monooxygenase (ABM) superfamily enzyme
LLKAKLTVRIRGSHDRPDEFETWMTQDHFPKMLAYPGVEDASLLRKFLGDDPFQYTTVYTFRDAEALRGFMSSDELAGLSAEFDELWGEASTRQRFAYEELS